MGLLIKDIATFKQFLKVNFSMTNAGLPDTAKAETRNLLPIVGQDLLDVLKAQVDLVAIEEDYVDLVERCRRVIAPAALLLNLGTKSVNLGDTGLKQIVADNTQPAFRWQFEKVETELQEELAVCSDELYQYLYINRERFDWTDPSGDNILFHSAEDFKYFFSSYQPYRVFPLLKPIINQVIELYINDSIGEDFYKELIAIDAPGTEEKRAIELLKKAVAHFAISRSVEKLPVKITAQGFTVLLGDAPDKTYGGDKHAPDNMLSLLKDTCDRDGNAFLQKLKDYLNAKASDSLFETYKGSSYYSDPETTADESRNAGKKSFRL